MTRPLVLALAASLLAPAATLAGFIERHPVVDDGRLAYRGELEDDDMLRVSETVERALIYERTGGDELRSLDPDCVAESADRVRCGRLDDRSRLLFSLIAGEDTLDASRVRTFRIEAGSGSGRTKLIGGALGDVLSSNNGDDVLVGGAGDDRLNADAGDGTTQPDADLLDGGPGADVMIGGAKNDRLLARDGERDQVDCGTGAGDVAVVDSADIVRGCEVVELPAPASPPDDRPQPAPAAGRPAAAPAPPAAPAAERERATDLRGVVSLPRRGRCLGRRGLRIRVRPAAGFVPASTRLLVDGRRRATRRGSRATLRLRPTDRRRASVFLLVTARDGRRLKIRRSFRRC